MLKEIYLWTICYLYSWLIIINFLKNKPHKVPTSFVNDSTACMLWFVVLVVQTVSDAFCYINFWSCKECDKDKWKELTIKSKMIMVLDFVSISIEK